MIKEVQQKLDTLHKNNILAYFEADNKDAVNSCIRILIPKGLKKDIKYIENIIYRFNNRLMYLQKPFGEMPYMEYVE